MSWNIEEYKKLVWETLSEKGYFLINNKYNFDMQTRYLIEVILNTEFYVSELVYKGFSFKETNLQSLIPVIYDSPFTERMGFHFSLEDEEDEEAEVEKYFIQPLQTICAIHPIKKLTIVCSEVPDYLARSISIILSSETNSINEFVLSANIIKIDLLLEGFIHSNCKLETLLLDNENGVCITVPQLEKLLQTRNLRKIEFKCQDEDIDDIIPILKKSCLIDFEIHCSEIHKQILRYMNFLVKTDTFHLWLLLLSVKLKKKRTEGLSMLPNELIRKVIMAMEPPPYIEF